MVVAITIRVGSFDKFYFPGYKFVANVDTFKIQIYIIHLNIYGTH